MNSSLLKEIYEVNKKIDYIFKEKYSADKNLHDKNCIGFLVELGEFINETKCFKYWSIKSRNKLATLEEYADVITSLLMFFGDNNIELDNLPNHKDYELFELLNYIYFLATRLFYNERVEQDLLSNIFYLQELLGLDEKEVYEAIKRKQKIVLDRLNDENY